MKTIRESVLDDGYVELIDFMGDDNAPIDAARVSFGKDSSQFTDEQNDKLRNYLLAHKHETPFEMVTFKFRMRAPVVVWWHVVRHRIASYNFISGRYTEFVETDVYKVADDKWRYQSKDNKQGSSEDFLPVIKGMLFGSQIENLYDTAFALYQEMLNAGVAREQARLVLPFGAVYYDAIVQMNGRSLMNFLSLRTSGDAQSETRSYADAIKRIVQQTHPKTFQEKA